MICLHSLPYLILLTDTAYKCHFHVFSWPTSTIIIVDLPTFTTMSANKLYTSLNNTSQLSQDVGPRDS